jgi:hypothetical protein
MNVHRVHLDRENQQKESHLHPEEPVAQIELGLLLHTAERAQEARREPEESRETPQAVRLKEPLKQRRIFRMFSEIPQAPAPSEDGPESDREREDMQRRERGSGDHARIIAGANISDLI